MSNIDNSLFELESLPLRGYVRKKTWKGLKSKFQADLPLAFVDLFAPIVLRSLAIAEVWGVKSFVVNSANGNRNLKHPCPRKSDSLALRPFNHQSSLHTGRRRPTPQTQQETGYSEDGAVASHSGIQNFGGWTKRTWELRARFARLKALPFFRFLIGKNLLQFGHSPQVAMYPASCRGTRKTEP